MRNAITIAQLVISALLVGSILMQSRGSGIGATFGGGDNVYRTTRGLEKGLFYATIVLAVLFFGLALAAILLPEA